MTEIEAEAKIKNCLPDDIKGVVIEVVKREALTVEYYTAIFGLILKHDKNKVYKIVKAVRLLGIDEPDIKFSGSVIDETFDLVNSAIYINVKCN